MAKDTNSVGPYRGGNPDLIANASEYGRRGGLATAANAKRRASMREAMKTLLSCDAMNLPAGEQLMAVLQEMGVENPSVAEAIGLAQVVKALRGDTDAFKAIRDTAGENINRIDLSLSDRPIDAMDLSQMSDDELRAMAGARMENVVEASGPPIAEQATEPEE